MTSATSTESPAPQPYVSQYTPSFDPRTRVEGSMRRSASSGSDGGVSSVVMNTGSEMAVSPGWSAISGGGGAIPKRVRTDNSAFCRPSSSVPTMAGVAGIRAVSTVDVALMKV